MLLHVINIGMSRLCRAVCTMGWNWNIIYVGWFSAFIVFDYKITHTENTEHCVTIHAVCVCVYSESIPREGKNAMLSWNSNNKSAFTFHCNVGQLLCCRREVCLLNYYVCVCCVCLGVCSQCNVSQTTYSFKQKGRNINYVSLRFKPSEIAS